MYDIHTHLYWNSYDTDRDEVIARARKAGVEKMFVIGTTVEESRQAIQLAEKYPELSASVGIHPHTFNEAGVGSLESWMRGLTELAKQKKVVAIGECGLDYHSHDKQKTINHEQKTAQREGFTGQIKLASELELPLIVHCRASSPMSDDAYRDLLGALSPITYNLKAIILHCYLGDTEITQEFMRLSNVYFSFAGNITYPVKKVLEGTKHDIAETVKIVPLDRIFAETDCPFLAPQDHRGKRNEPAFARSVLTQIAALKGVDERGAEAVTTATTKQVFGV